MFIVVQYGVVAVPVMGGKEGGELLGHAVMCPACGIPHVFYNPEHPTEDGHSWAFDGDQVLPTFKGAMLVEDENGTYCHFYLEGGRIDYLPDCRHAFAGISVTPPTFVLAEPPGIKGESKQKYDDPEGRDK